MRVVVIGPYPPSPDPVADTVLAVVRALRAAGAAVTVVSPAPSAAPAHGDPTRWAGATIVARVVRGADRVVWFAPADASPARPLRRALASVGSVERRTVAREGGTAARDRSWSARVRRVRAGAPTWVRTMVHRWRRR